MSTSLKYWIMEANKGGVLVDIPLIAMPGYGPELMTEMYIQRGYDVKSIRPATVEEWAKLDVPE